MEKTYYIYCGIEMNDIMEFIKMIMEMCLSFEYDHEAGTITVKGVRERLIHNIGEWLANMDIDIHDKEEQF